MKWLTLEQVAKAANRGPKTALKCSQEHWLQMSTATQAEMKAFIEADDCNTPPWGPDYCALCQRYRYEDNACDNCPLCVVGNHCGRESLYEVATDHLLEWTKTHDRKAWQRWKYWSAKMYETLRELEPGK